MNPAVERIMRLNLAFVKVTVRLLNNEERAWLQLGRTVASHVVA